MVGDAVAEERQLHSQPRIVGMNMSYTAARSGTNSHEYVAGASGQLGEQASTAESATWRWAC